MYVYAQKRDGCVMFRRAVRAVSSKVHIRNKKPISKELGFFYALPQSKMSLGEMKLNGVYGGIGRLASL